MFDAHAARAGAVVCGRNTYDDSERFGDDGSPHPTAPLFVLSHRPALRMRGRQTLVTTGIEDAVAAAKEAAGGKDVGLMGGGVVTDALKAGRGGRARPPPVRQPGGHHDRPGARIRAAQPGQPIADGLGRETPVVALPVVELRGERGQHHVHQLLRLGCTGLGEERADMQRSRNRRHPS